MNKKFFIFPVIGVAILFFVLFTTQNLFSSDETDLTLTGTPADNFSEEQRSKFCGTGNATSNDYVQEYKIPTECTMPQAIMTDPDGNIWFVESNTGNLAKFIPTMESFTEYENPFWPKTEHSMMWGLDYASDDTIWFTDEKYNSVWKFNIQDEEYSRLPFPSAENSSPQRLEIQGSQLIINDFKGNRLVFADYVEFSERLVSYSIPSIHPNAVTADFIIDDDSIWYTSWIPDDVGTLIKINKTKVDLLQNDGDTISPDRFSLPAKLNAPNGITTDNAGNLWLVDSSSSLFFKFNPRNENFTQYVTSNPPESTFGNFTGEIKSPPVSGPYWIDVDPSGNLVFNEPGSNKIGVFDPLDDSLVEYSVPSKNPHWGDCSNAPNCGISQIFDFVIKGDKIWFTEWAENNLGVVDTTIPLPFEILLSEDEIFLQPGESKKLNFTIRSNSENELSTTLIFSDSSEFLDLQINDSPLELLISDSDSINVTLHAHEELIPGEYKVLLGAETDQVSIGQFVTVVVDSTTDGAF